MKSVTLVLVVFAVVVSVSRAADSASGVAFVSDGELVAVTKPRLTVELFNGSPEARTLRLSVAGAIADSVTIEPKTKMVGPGRVGTFRVILRTAATKALTGQLRAYSTDGTLARAALRAGPADGRVASDAQAGYPKSVDFGVTEVGNGASVAVPRMPGSTQRTQVGHVSGPDATVAVTRTGDTIAIKRLPHAGEYTGTIDLAPGVEGGLVDLTAHARGPWACAVVALLGGLGIAVISELFLRRFRPQWALKRRLLDLADRVDHAQNQANDDVKQGNPREPGWSIPVIYAGTGTDASLLAGRMEEITQSLKSAPSDAQRERWGPDGTEMGALEQQIAAYRTLIGDLRALAQEWRAFTAQNVDPELAEATPLRADLKLRLDGKVLGEGGLEREQKLTTSLADSVAALTTLHQRLVHLERDAPAGLRDKIAKKRIELLKSYAGPDDQKRFADDVTGLAKEIYGEPSQAAPVPVAPAPPPIILATSLGDDLFLATAPRLRRHAASLSLAPLRTPAPRAKTTSLSDVLSRNLSLADLAFFILSAAVVVATGLVTLYYTNESFGTFGDYLALITWGATGAAALSFARTALPGALSSLGAK